MTDSKRFFRAAGYVFTWGDERSPGCPTTLEMYRESATGQRRYFVARARCAANRERAYARALAMVAWVRSLEVPVRRDPQAQAVLEQVAILRDRLARLDARAPAEAARREAHVAAA